jgi:hypothetical protein
VTAELHLDLRREPAKPETLLLAHEERGLGEIVLEADRLHRGVGKPGIERHHGRGIAAE